MAARRSKANKAAATPGTLPARRVDALGTTVSTVSLGRTVAMFLGVPQELSSAAGGSLMGDASNFYTQRVEQALWDEVGEIAAHDPVFDIRTFADETSTAFLKLQRAFAAQDAGAARKVLAMPLWEQARHQIEEYRRDGRRNVQEQLQIQQVRFLGAHSRNGYDTVGLRIFTATVDYDIDVANGKIVRRDKMLHPVAVDVLAERSSDAQTSLRAVRCASGARIAALGSSWSGTVRAGSARPTS